MNDPVFGIHTRILRGIVHHFPLRHVEWLMALWAVTWGGRLILDPADNFATHAGSFNMLTTVFRTDTTFGTIMVALGVMRMLALAINGTFHDTLYARYSPVVRGVTSFLCGLAWFLVALSSLSVASQAAATYPFPCVIDFFTAYYVAGESGDTLRAHHNGRRNLRAD